MGARKSGAFVGRMPSQRMIGIGPIRPSDGLDLARDAATRKGAYTSPPSIVV